MTLLIATAACKEGKTHGYMPSSAFRNTFSDDDTQQQEKLVETCPFCYGTGSSPDETGCGFCNGKGMVGERAARQARHVIQGGTVEYQNHTCRHATHHRKGCRWQMTDDRAYHMYGGATPCRLYNGQ